AISTTRPLPGPHRIWTRRKAMKALRSFLLALSVLLLCASSAGAQPYPVKPIRLIVADAAGGAPDQLGRILAQAISAGLRQQVVVDNRPGAAGALGADIAARSPSDGYSLLLTTTAIY